MSYHFGSDSYYPALGYRQGTKSCFALTDIRTNQQPIIIKSYKEQLWPERNTKSIRTSRYLYLPASYKPTSVVFRSRSAALGYRQGIKSCFVLTDIRTNQQRTNRYKLSHTESSFGGTTHTKKKTILTNRYSYTGIVLTGVYSTCSSRTNWHVP